MGTRANSRWVYLLCRSGSSGMRGQVSRPLLVHASSLHVAMGVVNSRLLRRHGGRRRLVRLGAGGEGRQGQTCSKSNRNNFLQHLSLLQ